MAYLAAPMYFPGYRTWGLSFHFYATVYRPPYIAAKGSPTVLSASTMNEWNTDLYQKKHSFVYEYGTSLIDIARPQPGETILDIGCGTGELTYQLYTTATSTAGTLESSKAKAAGTSATAEIGIKSDLEEPFSSLPAITAITTTDNSNSAPTIVIGIDADQNMISKAQAQYSNEGNVQFLTSDIRNFLFDETVTSNHDIPKSYDLIFSNAALHWIPQTDIEKVVQQIAQMLKPNGRFVVEFGGKGNIDTIVTACQDILQNQYDVKDVKSPWYFPSISEFTTLLERYGIEVTSAVLYDRPTKLQDPVNGMKDWIQMFGRPFIDRALSASISSSAPVDTESSSTCNSRSGGGGSDHEQMVQLFVTAVNERLKSSKLFNGYEWNADYRRIRIVAYKRPTVVTK